MTTINKNKPVAVTGATGYLAGWIVKKLLDEGLTVHAAVRNPDKKEKTKHLEEMATNSKGEIKFFRADLLSEGSYDEAMKDCELVIHTASPFFLNVKDPQKDLVDPALNGTRNVLNSVNRTESVKRVVLTSSCAAIYGDNIDIQKAPNQTLTEDIWNTTSNLKHQAYSYSKTMAEKEAWKMKEAQNRWDLVVMNPCFILGPATNPHANGESLNFIKQMGDGTMKFGAPPFHMGMVDVRDVAEAHFKGGFTPSASGRHILKGKEASVLDLANMLRPNYGDKYPLPKSELPKFMVWLMAPMVGMKRKEVKRTLGYPWRADNSKSINELGMKYRPLETTINDFFGQMVEEGVI